MAFTAALCFSYWAFQTGRHTEGLRGGGGLKGLTNILIYLNNLNILDHKFIFFTLSKHSCQIY